MAVELPISNQTGYLIPPERKVPFARLKKAKRFGKGRRIRNVIGNGCRSLFDDRSGIKTAYDDGGLSGATMNRPALQHLLSDIRERMVDVVVVYKVDRLTRSLAELAKKV